MVRRWWWLAAMIVMVVVTAFTYEPPSKGDEFTLLFTATVNGNLEPCGCPVNPSGGVARRTWYIRQHAPKDHPAVLLDGGDVVGPPTPKGLLQTEYLFQAMHHMGYTVVGLGARDLAFGVDFLRAAERKYGLTFTSANLVGAGGELVFAPYAVMRVGRGRALGVPFGGQRIGVISVMGFDLQPICPSCDPPLALLRPFESVQRTASAIRRGVDLVVVMAYTDQEGIEQILSIPDVDVVIASRTLYPPDGFDNVGRHGHAAIGYTGYEGRRIGEMHIRRGDEGRIASVEGDLHNLGEDVPDDPALAGIVAAHRNESARLAPERPEERR